MPTKNKPVQFSLNQAQHELLMEQGKWEESPGQVAKRILMAALEATRQTKGRRLRSEEEARVIQQRLKQGGEAGAQRLAEAMGVLEEEVAEATLPSRALQQTRKNVETAGKLAGAKKKPATTIEQERAQAAERMRAALRPKHDNNLEPGWPAEVRSQDEIDFDDVPVFGAAPPDEPVELPEGRRK